MEYTYKTMCFFKKEKRIMKSRYVIMMILMNIFPLDLIAMNLQQFFSDPTALMKVGIRQKYPARQTSSQVRQGQELCPREVNFIENRSQKVNLALKEYFEIDTSLKIGLCCSGGGNRAMLVSLGFLLGAQDIGLFDAAYYTAGLSGSTWTLVPFSYFNATQDMTLTKFKDQLIIRLDSIMKTVIAGVPPVPVFSQAQNMSIQNDLIKRFAYEQYLSSIDIYGNFIGDYTLLPAGDNRFDVTWSSIANQIEKGNIPLPMGSAVADKPKGKDDYYWFEFGPFEAGSDQLGAYVPIEAFGSKFENGKTLSNYTGYAPEYSLSFYQGVFGSAFTASMNEINRFSLTPYETNVFGQKVSFSLADVFVGLDDNVSESNNYINNLRFSPACFYNYTLGLKTSPIAQEDKLKLYDGGLAFDLPLPLLMRSARDLDLIVACDAMVDLTSLKLAAVHFKRNNIKFPDVSDLTEAIISKPLTVLNDPRMANYDKDMITIAYCPFIKNDTFSTEFDPIECREKGFCNTLNFNYTKEQAEQVIGLTRYNVNFIKNEIKSVLQALQRQKTSLVTMAFDSGPKALGFVNQNLKYLTV